MVSDSLVIPIIFKMLHHFFVTCLPNENNFKENKISPARIQTGTMKQMNSAVMHHSILIFPSCITCSVAEVVVGVVVKLNSITENN